MPKNMRIVIPINADNARQVPGMLATMVHFQTLENHFITLVPAPAQLSVAQDAFKKLKAVCPNTDVATMAMDLISNVPRAENTQFQWAMRHLQDSGNQFPWLWMTPYCRPRCKFWADKLSTAYAMAQNPKPSPFVGNVRLTPSPVTENDQMMMGTGIYPADMMRHSDLWRDLGSASVSTEEPFFRYLRLEMMRAGLAHTDLIGDRYDTSNYRDTPDLACDWAKTDPNASDHSKNDVSQAVLIAGVMDDSLDSIILGKAPEMPPAEQAKVPVVNSPELLPQYVTPDAMEKFGNTLMASISEMVDRKLAPKTAISEPSTESEPKSHGLDLDAAMSLLGTKKWTLVALAQRLGCSKPELEELLSAQGCTFSGIPKWIQLPQLQTA